jgi:hypothetical protein
VAPLAPATISTVELWSQANVWEVTTLNAGPLGGFFLRSTGPYRFTASVGGGEVPADVNEAFRRLAEYMAAKPGKPEVRSESVSAGSITVSDSRDESWIANALVNSGAADLLRDFRRV